MRTNEEHEEQVAVDALTRRQWQVYDFARQGYRADTIAKLMGYPRATILQDLTIAVHAIAAALEQQDEGHANTNLTTQRRWQGNDTATLPNETLVQAIYREQRRQQRSSP